MIDFTRSINELVKDVTSGRVSAVQMALAALDNINDHKDLNAVLEINPAAEEWARFVDKAIKEGRDLPLAGIPFIAKDNFLTFHTHTTAASKILEPFRAPYQSTAVELLEKAGAIMVAKANLDAFAHGSSTENSDFGPTKNPVDHSRVPGGSSGGSAAVVAAGIVPFALGTDTGGSIRLPASYCGVVGLKPTYGLVSRYGVVAMGSSVDVIGPIARTAEDAAVVLDAMAGRDEMDSTTIGREGSYVGTHQMLKGLKVGVIKEYMGDGIDLEVKDRTLKTIDRLKSAGAEVEEVSLPSTGLALACYYILVPAEVSSNLSRYDGVKYGYSAPEAKTLADTYDLSRDQGFGAEAKRRILVGTYVLSSGYYDAYYKKAQAVRTLIVQEFEKAFAKYDVLVGPTAPDVAFPLGQKARDPLAMYMTDICTVAVNLAGVAAISIPVGDNSDGLPIGFQIIAPQKGEKLLLGVAKQVEELVS